MDINSVNHGGSHDHCWGPKMQQQEWQVQKPWDWEGVGIYSSDKYERMPVTEWAGSEESFIGKEFFRGSGGSSMDHVSSISAVSDPVMVSNMTKVIGENHMGKSYSTNKSQCSLQEKIAPSSAIKSEENGIKYWLVEGTDNIGNGYLGTNNAGYGSANVHYHGGEISGGISDNKGVKDVQGDSLTCLKLGKRQYFEDNSNLTKTLPVSFSVTNNPSHVFKKPRSLVGSNTQPPRCQVEGCNVGLANAKDYHKRHKVCELHSKAPKVIVVGMEQRFCQQCSRFHVISEFDDAKRSCRRRLAGHNERRRKSSSDALANSTGQEEKRIMCISGERFPFARYNMPYTSSSCGRGALSLLSTQQPWTNPSSCILSGDLSSRSSAALRELIAENRVQSLSRYSDDNRSQYQRGSRITRSMQQPFSIQDDQQQQLQNQTVGNSRFMPGLRSLENPVKTSFEGDGELKKHGEVIGNNVVVRPTLDLMQHSDSLFALESGKNRSSSSSSSSEECEIWKSWEGTQMA